jgi:hypothetical protein
MKRMLLLLVLVSGFGFALPTKADASKAVVGRIIDYSATSLSVRDKEILTVRLDESTTYTKLITQKPWEADTRLSAGAPSPAFSAPQSAPAPSTTSKANSSDLLTSKQVKALIATANTPADHVKLQKHFLAVAAKYEADATEHAAEAQAYRKNPSFMESKNPAGPGTAAHCDRFAQLDREAAKEARDLASAHEHMAAAR